MSRQTIVTHTLASNAGHCRQSSICILDARGNQVKRMAIRGG